MIKFSTYLKEELLNESLDSPVEFYMTDDTKMPNEIYGAFKINDEDYGISLIKSKYDKVYVLELYRIVNVKKRTWSFKNPKHIRPALSTVIKFVEATYPFIQAKVHGIIIDIPGKTGSERFVSFMSRMIKKSYIKKFREVPIKKTTDKAKNYLFMVKNGVEPTSIFKTATFWKNFSFDHKEEELIDIADLDMDSTDNLEKDFWNAISNVPELPSDIMDTAAKPYKKVKPNVSLTPSKKYVLGKTEVEFSAGQDLIDQLEAATGLTEKTKVTLEDHLAKSGIKKMEFQGAGLSIISKNSSFYLLTNLMVDAVGKIKNNGFDPSKFDFNNFKYAFAQSFKKMPKTIQQSIIETGLANLNGEWVKDDIAAKDFLEQVGWAFYEAPDNVKSDAMKKHDAVYKYIGKVRSAESSYSVTSDSSDVKTLNWGVQPTVDDPRMEYLNNLTLDSRFNMNVSNSTSLEGYEQAKAYLFENNKEVADFYNDPTKYTSPERYQIMRSYTGTAYENMNSNMRKLIDVAKSSSGIAPSDILEYGNDKAIELFVEDAPRLESPMWVIRNMNVPPNLLDSLEPGEEFVDPAFLSTTIRSTVTYGYSNGRMKIYLPAGTPIFPALESHSNISSEAEIILPPSSVIKITKSLQINSTTKVFEGIYLGNAANGIYYKVKAGKSFLEEQMSNEPKSLKGEQKGYDGPSLESMKYLLGTIKSGKLKLDTEDKKKK